MSDDRAKMIAEIARPWRIDEDNAERIVIKDDRGTVVHQTEYDDIPDEINAAFREQIIKTERINAHAIVSAINSAAQSKCRDCGHPLDLEYLHTSPRSCIKCSPEFGDQRAYAVLTQPTGERTPANTNPSDWTDHERAFFADGWNDCIAKQPSVALPAALSSPLPEGWRLAPSQATDKMVRAGREVSRKHGSGSLRVIYFAMLAAAPQPPHAGEGPKT